MAILDKQNDVGVRVDFSQQEILRFEKDFKKFVSKFGEKKAAQVFRNAINRYPLKEAKSILANEAGGGSGSLEDRGLIVTKEKGSQETGSFLMGGGRAKKNIHGFIAHWVELGTSGVVRDGGERYKSGQRYRSATAGIHFLERAAKDTSGQVFEAVNKAYRKPFNQLGK